MKKIYWLDIYSETKYRDEYENRIADECPGFPEEDGDSVCYNEADAQEFREKFPNCPLIELDDPVERVRAIYHSMHDYCGTYRWYFGDYETLEEFEEDYDFDDDDIDRATYCGRII